MRELHFHSLLRTKELEVQWNLSRYEQQRKQAEQESHRAKALHAQVSTFSQTEAELRSQLNIYVEKFKQVINQPLIDCIHPILVAVNKREKGNRKGTRELAFIQFLVGKLYSFLYINLGRRYTQQLQRPLPHLPQGNGRNVQKDQAPRKGESRS